MWKKCRYLIPLVIVVCIITLLIIIFRISTNKDYQQLKPRCKSLGFSLIKGECPMIDCSGCQQPIHSNFTLCDDFIDGKNSTLFLNKNGETPQCFFRSSDKKCCTNYCKKFCRRCWKEKIVFTYKTECTNYCCNYECFPEGSNNFFLGEICNVIHRECYSIIVKGLIFFPNKVEENLFVIPTLYDLQEVNTTSEKYKSGTTINCWK